MEDLTQLAYAVDTFYFLVMGALVMFMAPGFAMLEAGMVRAKNTSEILTKNVALFSIAQCIMAAVIGYDLMYAVRDDVLGPENTVDDVLASGGDVYYSARSISFSGCFRSDSDVNYFRSGCRAYKALVLLVVSRL